MITAEIKDAIIDTLIDNADKDLFAGLATAIETIRHLIGN